MEQTNGGIQKLTARILEQAQREADATLAQAQAQCSAIAEDARAQMKRNATISQNKCFAKMADIRSRSRTNAELEARKTALAAKRQIIAEAFDMAGAQLCSLPAEARARLCKSLLEAEAEGGERIAAAANDRAALSKLVPDISARLEQQGKKPLELLAEDAPVEYGFFLYGQGYEKDCSFRALLEELKNREESAVARLLFEQEG